MFGLLHRFKLIDKASQNQLPNRIPVAPTKFREVDTNLPAPPPGGPGGPLSPLRPTGPGEPSTPFTPGLPWSPLDPFISSISF